MSAKPKRVKHVKMGKAEVSLILHGKSMEIVILCRPELEKRIARRLINRFPTLKSGSKRKK